MSQNQPGQKETLNKTAPVKMFSTPLMKKISNIVCPNAPIKHRLTEVVVDDDKLHEIIVHARKIVF